MLPPAREPLSLPGASLIYCPLRLDEAPLLDTQKNMGISQLAFTLFYNYL